MSDPTEPASVLAERVYMLYGSPRAAQLIESDRAAVREPLERRNRELETLVCDEREVILQQRERIASLEAQLKTARERVALEWEMLDDAAEQLDGDEHEARSAMLSRIEALLTSPPKSPWVLTAERLPEKGVRVLFWLAGGPGEGGVHCTGALSKNERATVWLDDETNDDACIEWPVEDVTHWMPLPPPPADQKENSNVG